MSSRVKPCLTMAVFGLAACVRVRAADLPAASAETVRWFQETEQTLMGAVAKGQKDVWDRVMDPGCVITSEEGQVTGKQQFLEEFRPLLPVLPGAIRVRDLRVPEFP